MLLVHDATKLKVKELGKLSKSKIWKPMDEWVSAKALQKILVLRVFGNLAFSNAESLYDQLTNAIRKDVVGIVVLEKIRILV